MTDEQEAARISDHFRDHRRGDDDFLRGGNRVYVRRGPLQPRPAQCEKRSPARRDHLPRRTEQPMRKLPRAFLGTPKHGQPLRKLPCRLTGAIGGSFYITWKSGAKSSRSHLPGLSSRPPGPGRFTGGYEQSRGRSYRLWILADGSYDSIRWKSIYLYGLPYGRLPNIRPSHLLHLPRTDQG